MLAERESVGPMLKRGMCRCWSGRGDGAAEGGTEAGVDVAAPAPAAAPERLTMLVLRVGPPRESWRRTGRGSRPLSECVVPSVAPCALILSSPTHQSHSSQPMKVAKLPKPTTDTGLTRSWKMPTKHTTKMMTEHTCWTITVESATSGQKSYGLTRGLRWSFSRKVA